jgi:hypothetical protein
LVVSGRLHGGYTAVTRRLHRDAPDWSSRAGAPRRRPRRRPRSRPEGPRGVVTDRHARDRERATRTSAHVFTPAVQRRAPKRSKPQTQNVGADRHTRQQLHTT